jgi:hypothetical protein
MFFEGGDMTKKQIERISMEGAAAYMAFSGALFMASGGRVFETLTEEERKVVEGRMRMYRDFKAPLALYTKVAQIFVSLCFISCALLGIAWSMQQLFMILGIIPR